MRQGRALVLGLLVALLCALLVAPAAVAQSGGLELRSVTELSPRLEQLRVYSPALAHEANVRVLTPEGFDSERDHLPVLWLLHGGFGSAADWTAQGDAAALTEELPMIVVMADAGTGGWYTNWKRGTAEGPQRWETFHLDELRPFIEERYQTRVDRGGRAIAGLSMGGFGAMHYAARHPDLFGFAASFSGAVDLLHPGVTVIVTISPLAHQGLPGDVFGLPLLEQANWRAHNPVDLAANLRTVEVQLRTGNGQPGPHSSGYDFSEGAVAQATASLHGRLNALGIPHVYEVHNGSHSWPYWRDDLEATLPAITAFFARTASVPAAA